MKIPQLLPLCLCLVLANGAQPLAAQLPAPTPDAQPTADVQLDPDGNGLYDDTERKAMLDVLSREVPELGGPFDTDGDGKVTIEEEAAGRHPLTQIIPRSFVKSGTKIPWALNLFPEWLSSAYFQEDVEVSEHIGHMPRGHFRYEATQTNEALRPAKSTVDGGVEFAANSGQHLSMIGRKDAHINFRWCVFTFRIDAESGSADETVLLDYNTGRGAFRSTPKISYHKQNGLRIQYVGNNKGGLDQRVMTTQNLITDGKGWNVVVCGTRHGQMYASVNGVELSTKTKQPERFAGGALQENGISLIGHKGNAGNMAWAYDSLVFGLTEPTEAMVRKMTGWAAHRLGFADRLPSNHPYIAARPVLDIEDLPRRYILDEEKWAAWGASLKKEFTRSNAGGPRVEPKNFVRVFYDDFRAPRVKSSASGEGDLWFGPGFNPATGYDARLIAPGREPNAYVHDAEAQTQTLSLVKSNNRWFASGFYSVNDLGHGYTWKGPKIFRMRGKFPYIPKDKLPAGLFPCFWSYDPQFLFWRTSNRIELDYTEFDGGHAHWHNSLSSHYHYAQVKNIFAKNDKTHKRYKGYSGELTEEKSKIPGGIYIWDGQMRTWEWVIDEDMIYNNVTIIDENGQEKWVEIFRTPITASYLEALDLQLVYAARAKRGMPDSDRVDWIIDEVEVLQKPSIFEAVPEPFTANPKLTGTVQAGSTVTCEPNVAGITDVRYYWFADGYPLTFGPSPTYTLTAAEVGKEIRCMVKAVGALDSPDSWSNPLR